MPDQPPRVLIAGEREAGVLCTCCKQPIQLGESVAICRGCGEVHHQACWQANDGCSGYECQAPAHGSRSSRALPVLRISHDELSSAEPLPARITPDDARMAALQAQPLRWNRTGVWAFVVALLGIPLFGLLTGLVAMVLACVALVVHHHRHRGLSLAIAAMVIGLVDILGWGAGLAYYLRSPHASISLEDLAIDPESLRDLPEFLRRAMQANVLIRMDSGLGRAGFGSGVVLRIEDESAYILTNRHVIDRRYTDRTRSGSDHPEGLADVTVVTVEQTQVAGKVVWLAPYGVDLAIVLAPMLGAEMREALWSRDAGPRIGDKVFAIGNPHGLGWTHSSGTISQIRQRERDGFGYKVFQTTTALNPGNSGGGLYDEQGRLIGINTATGDKRFAEGLGFSIAFSTLLDLVPERFRLSAAQGEAQ